MRHARGVEKYIFRETFEESCCFWSDAGGRPSRLAMGPPECGGIAGKRRQFGGNEEIAFADEKSEMLTSKSLLLTSKSECLRPCNNGSPARRTELQLACSRISDT